MDTRKISLIVVTILTLIAILIGASYAYFIAQTESGQSANINLTANTTDSLKFETGKNLNLNVTKENFGEGAGNVNDATTAKATLIANNKTNVASYNYYLYLQISKNEFDCTTEERIPEILLQVTKPEGLITIADNKLIEVIESNAEHKTEEEWQVGIVAQCIKENYKLDSSIYYHDSSLKNGAEDNSCQYAGAHDTVNNFVCFGSEETQCPNDNLYRIIGVFDNEVKLIKYDYAIIEQPVASGDYYQVATSESTYQGEKSKINLYYWNNINEDNFQNNWNESRLNTIYLNETYLRILGTLWADKIALTSWQVGGLTWASGGATNAKTAYDYELGKNKINKTYEAKV